jgi:hypothetical protein
MSAKACKLPLTAKVSPAVHTIPTQAIAAQHRQRANAWRRQGMPVKHASRRMDARTLARLNREARLESVLNCVWAQPAARDLGSDRMA